MSCLIQLTETTYGYNTSKKIWFDYFSLDLVEVEGEWDTSDYTGVYVGCTCPLCDKQEHHTVEFRNYFILNDFFVKSIICLECLEDCERHPLNPCEDSDTPVEDYAPAFGTLFDIPGVQYQGPRFPSSP